MYPGTLLSLGRSQDVHDQNYWIGMAVDYSSIDTLLTQDVFNDSSSSNDLYLLSTSAANLSFSRGTHRRVSQRRASYRRASHSRASHGYMKVFART